MGNSIDGETSQALAAARAPPFARSRPGRGEIPEQVLPLHEPPRFDSQWRTPEATRCRTTWYQSWLGELAAEEPVARARAIAAAVDHEQRERFADFLERFP